MMKNRIGIVGLWHLGCTLSACWADLGHSVVSYDENEDLVQNLMQGHPPIYEPNLENLLKKQLEAKTLSFTHNLSDLKDCEFIFLTYDTPVLDGDESDLTPLENAINQLGSILDNEAIVIVSSQTPAGTCSKFRKQLQKKNQSLELAYSPENLRLGEAIQSYLNPGRIILGTEKDSARTRLTQLFSKIKAEVLPMNLASAEMVKHGINSFLALSVTFANQLADLCEVSGADIADVIKGMKTDPRIGMKAYLSPGIGFSGGTLGRDLKVLHHLNQDSHSKAGLFKTIHDLNSERKIIILDKLKKYCGTSLSSKKLGVLGLTYKPGTSTLRRSLPVEIVQLILKEGAKVSIFDPKADYSEYPGKNGLYKAGSIEEIISQSEVIVLLTEWQEFRSADWKKFFNPASPQIVFDTKNFLADLHLDQLGYQYIGMGKKLK